MKIIGIDPGKSGGMAVNTDGKITFVTGFSTLTDSEICWAIYSQAMFCNYCYLEKVGAVPADSKRSGRFGVFMVNYGMIQGALLLSGIPIIDVPPSVWQRKMKCLTGGDKKISRARAQRLFGYVKITHQTADACLISEYGRLKQGEK